MSSSLYLIITQVGTTTTPNPYVNVYHGTAPGPSGKISTTGNGTSIVLTNVNTGIDIKNALSLSDDVTEIHGFVLDTCVNVSDDSTGSDTLSFVDNNDTSYSSSAVTLDGYNFNTGTPSSLFNSGGPGGDPLPWEIKITFNNS